VLAFYAQDAVLEFPASPPARGLERIRRAFGAFFEQWEETSTYRSVLIAGRAAAGEGTSVGRHKTLQLRIPGRLAGGGGGYRHDFAMFLEFRGDKIVRHRVYYDARELVKQLLG
jgi:ketosteroid isomerase-like protein